MADRPSVETVLSVFVFQLHPTGRAAKQAVARGLAEIALFDAERPLALGEVRNNIGKLLQQGRVIPESDLSEALEACVRRGSVVASDGTYCLGETKRRELEDAVVQVADDEKAFDEDVMGSVRDQTPLGAAEVAPSLICTAVKRAIAACFESHAIAIQRLVGGGNLNFAAILDSAEAWSPLPYLEEELGQVARGLRYPLAADLIEAVKCGLGRLGDRAQRYVMTLYCKVFCLRILNLNPQALAVQKQCLQETRAYLDTNVILAYLLEGHPAHRPIADVINACRALGIQLCLSPFTKDEFAYQVAESRRRWNALRNPRITQFVVSTAGDPFISTFDARRRSRSSLAWAAFMAPFEHPEELLLERDILLEHEECDQVADDPAYGPAWDILRDIRYPSYPDEVVTHDAQNCVLVQRLRWKHGATILGPRVWFVTDDSNLATLDERLVGTFDLPHCQQIEDWGRMLMPFQNIHDFIFSDYIMYVLQSRLGVVSRGIRVDPDFLIALDEADIDVDALLTFSPEFGAQVLVRVQHDRIAREFIDRARTGGVAVEDREEARRKANHCVYEAVLDETEKFKQKSLEMEALARQKDSTIDDLHRRLEELSTRLEVLEKGTFWARIKRWLGRKSRRSP